jgi:hypothetical protein
LDRSVSLIALINILISSSGVDVSYARDELVTITGACIRKLCQNVETRSQELKFREILDHIADFYTVFPTSARRDNHGRRYILLVLDLLFDMKRELVESYVVEQPSKSIGYAAVREVFRERRAALL